MGIVDMSSAWIRGEVNGKGSEIRQSRRRKDVRDTEKESDPLLAGVSGQLVRLTYLGKVVIKLLVTCTYLDLLTLLSEVPDRLRRYRRYRGSIIQARFIQRKYLNVNQPCPEPSNPMPKAATNKPKNNVMNTYLHHSPFIPRQPSCSSSPETPPSLPF
jgi:hypothetical protein